jgi:hypothetical protein
MKTRSVHYVDRPRGPRGGDRGSLRIETFTGPDGSYWNAGRHGPSDWVGPFRTVRAALENAQLCDGRRRPPLP